MKRFLYADNGCTCRDCEHYRARQRAFNAAAKDWARCMARTAELVQAIIAEDRETLIQEQE